MCHVEGEGGEGRGDRGEGEKRGGSGEGRGEMGVGREEKGVGRGERGEVEKGERGVSNRAACTLCRWGVNSGVS